MFWVSNYTKKFSPEPHTYTHTILTNSSHKTNAPFIPSFDPPLLNLQTIYWGLINKLKHTDTQTRIHTECKWLYSLLFENFKHKPGKYNVFTRRIEIKISKTIWISRSREGFWINAELLGKRIWNFYARLFVTKLDEGTEIHESLK